MKSQILRLRRGTAYARDDILRVVMVLVIGLVLVPGCERSHSDMGEQDKYGVDEGTRFFGDGRSARPAVVGAVARDGGRVPGIVYAGDPGQGAMAVAERAEIPFEVTEAVVRRGQVGFDVYCSVCHGRLGNGEGMIVKRGFTRPPSFHVERLVKAGDGHFYNVISNGFGAMFGYGDRIRAEQRWEIVAYVRALQVGGETASDEVKRALVAGGDRQTPGVRGGGG